MKKAVAVGVVAVGLLASFGAGYFISRSQPAVATMGNIEDILNVQGVSQGEMIGQKQKEVTWIQLDQLKTHSNGFRQGFDKQFNITVVRESGIGGKSGCLYINPNGERDGNTALKDAMRNKVFQSKYWSDATIRNELVKLGNTVYVDISDLDESTSLLASLNAYYNLLNDSINPDAFNPTQSLSREEFYTLFLKANNPVYPLDTTKVATYESIAGQTEYSKYASQVADTGWLPISNHSLDSTNASGSITRLEAVYMVVANLFPEELAKATDSDKSYEDIKNAGDLALKAGFKEQLKDGSKTIREKDRWQAYSLAYSLQNPQKGVQRELYRASVVAKRLGLFPGEEMRWDESISKAEALQLLINAYEAQNTLYGYLTEAENGKIVNNFQVQQPGAGEIDANGGKAAEENMELVFNPNTLDFEEVYTGDKGEGEQGQEGNPDDPFAGMTEEDLMKELLDTSDALGKEDLIKGEPGKQGETEGQNQGQGGGQGQTGQTGGQGQSGTSGLTPEQQKELQKILDGLSGASGDDSRYHEGGTGGNASDLIGKGPSIDWNK